MRASAGFCSASGEGPVGVSPFRASGREAMRRAPSRGMKASSLGAPHAPQRALMCRAIGGSSRSGARCRGVGVSALEVAEPKRRRARRTAPAAAWGLPEQFRPPAGGDGATPARAGARQRRSRETCGGVVGLWALGPRKSPESGAARRRELPLSAPEGAEAGAASVSGSLRSGGRLNCRSEMGRPWR